MSPASPVRIQVLIPTRNRGDLVRRAAESVLAAELPEFTVAISDNSSDPAERARAQDFARSQAGRVQYLQPPGSLNMSEHWDWALGQVLQNEPTHVMVLTDRMVLRAGAAALLAQLARRHPDLLLCFNLDRVDDLTSPVTLERKRWSGAVCELPSAQVLSLAARCEFPDCIPRLLNGVTPVTALRKVQAGFGNICLSVSPDYGFGFRFLALHERFVYIDQSLLIHYAVNRSNGTSTLRGVATRDAKDFRAFMAEEFPFRCTPYPEFMTVGNAVLHEYGHVRETRPELPPVVLRAYLKMLWRDVVNLESAEARSQALAQLRRRGHTAFLMRRRASTWLKQRTRKLEHWGRRAARGEHFRPAALTFAGVDEALRYDRDHPAPRQASTGHLERLRPLSLQIAESAAP